ncbi:MAG: VOC family protein, partial [Planctomycetota bacterium]
EAFARNTNEHPAAPPAGAITGTEIYLHCDDLADAIAKLDAAGARLLSGRAPRDWGDEAAYFADPEGNVIVVTRPLPS